MGFNKNIENQVVSELKSILIRACDVQKIECVKYLIRYYYRRKAQYTNSHVNIRSLTYELEFQMLLDLNKINGMAQQELDSSANDWFEKLIVLDNFYS